MNDEGRELMTEEELDELRERVAERRRRILEALGIEPGDGGESDGD